MPIVTKRKAAGQALGRASWRRAAVLAAAALCLAAAWAFSRGRTASNETPQSPEGSGDAARSDVAAHSVGVPDGAPSAAATEPRPVGAVLPATQDSASKPSQVGSTAQGAAAEAPAPEPPASQPRRGREPVFDNQVENRLEVVSRKGFNSIVTLRVNLPQEEILEILKRPVEIYDDDDEETVAAKERTAKMKAAALDFIEAGGTFNQFLRDCQAEATEAREAVRDVRDEMKRILLEQGEEAAQAYLDEQNPLLREQGLEEVHIGKGLLRMAERRRAKEGKGLEQ